MEWPDTSRRASIDSSSLLIKFDDRYQVRKILCPKQFKLADVCYQLTLQNYHQTRQAKRAKRCR